MLNPSLKRPPWLLVLWLLAEASSSSGDDLAAGCSPLVMEDEVTELLQSSRRGNISNISSASAVGQQNGTARPESKSSDRFKVSGDGGPPKSRAAAKFYSLEVTRLALEEALVHLRRSMGRDDSDMGVILLSLVLLLGLVFLILTVCVVRSCTAGAGSVDKSFAVGFVQPAAALCEDALPAICGKFLANTRDQPFTVRLGPLLDQGDWTVDVLSNFSHKAILRVSLCRGAQKLEGALAMRRSCLQVRSFNGKYKDSLLGSVNSMLEIFLPNGEKFGQLVPGDDASHLLYEASGREPRYSIGLENPSTLSVVWLARNMSPKLQDGLNRMGGLPPRHSHKGSVLGTVARPEGSNGDRLELMNIAGTDTVLILLCAFGLIAFSGALDVVPTTEFEQERAGLGWVSMPPPESESPTARTSLTVTGGSAMYQRARDSLSSARAVCT